MNKKFAGVVAIIIVFLTIMISLQYVAQKDTQDGIVQVGPPLAIRDETYVSDTGEVRVRFLDREVFLTIIGNEYRDVALSKVESTSSGTRYENKELSLVLWDKLPEISVYKEGTLFFSGKTLDVAIIENLTSNVWVWTETLAGVGHEAELDISLYPRKSRVFTITFTDDGRISGTTDCNSFSGTYASMGDIQPVATTRKFCEYSQESEFLEMITGGSIGLGLGEEMYIERENTLVFKKGKKK